MDRAVLARSQVEAGAVWLDKHAPPGWISTIDLTNFDIADASLCALGQLWRSYGMATVWFELSAQRCADLGFLGVPMGARRCQSCCNLVNASLNDDLNDAWRAEITRRRIDSSPSDVCAGQLSTV